MVNNWPVKRMKISDLTASPSNARFIKDFNYEGLKSSLRRFGTVELPIFNERTKRLISGHQRVKALEELGETETDVICADFDETEESLANLTMNNPEITGQWTENAMELARSIEADDSRLFKALNFEPLMKDLEKLLPKVKKEDIAPMKLPDPDFDMICPCCRHKWLIGSQDIVTPATETPQQNTGLDVEEIHNLDIN
jgi:hypothetical protein